MNTVTIIGRIATDFDKSPNAEAGKGAVSFNLAVDRRDDGCDFIRVKAFNGQAKSLIGYKGKGDELGITGTLRQESWEKDGKKFSRIEVWANSIDWLRSKKATNDGEVVEEVAEDDIPF